jgi:hypothetical protein
MTCREFELRLAEGEFGAAVEDHLLECAECRALAVELRENAIALAAMREEELPWGTGDPAGSRLSGGSRGVRVWIPAAVAAALVLLALGLPRHRWESPPPPAHSVAASPTPAMAPAAPVAAAVARKPRRRIVPPKSVQPEETFMVKMLTPDPDVVVYWIVEPKERGSE